MLWLKCLLVFLIIAAAETVHGALRIRFLNRPLGDKRARQVGVVTGSATILLITWLSAAWLDIRSPGQALAVGALWMTLMLVFDIGVGMILFHFKMERILREFNPSKGGFLGLGMLVLLLAPWWVGRLKHWW